MDQRPPYRLEMPPQNWQEYEPVFGYGSPLVHPNHYASYAQSNSTPNLTPAREASSMASTPASSALEWTNGGGFSYFAPSPEIPISQQAQQARPRRAQSTSSLRHSPYPHASPVMEHAQPDRGGSTVVTQACERLSSAAHRLESMVHAVAPTMSKSERDEVEAMLDAAMADLKACFFGQNDNPAPVAKRRPHAGSMSMSNMMAMKQRESVSPQQQTQRRPSLVDPPPLLHSQSTPVVPTFGNGTMPSNSSMAIGGLHQSTLPVAQPAPTLATLMQETANNPSLLSEPLQMPSLAGMFDTSMSAQPVIRSVPPTPAAFNVHGASPLAVSNPFAHEELASTPIASPQLAQGLPEPPFARPLLHKRSSSFGGGGGHVRSRSNNASALRYEQSVPIEGDGSVVLGSDVPNLTSERKAALDAAFVPWLETVCKDANMTDAKGEGIHQTLMAKKMQSQDSDDKFRLFKFRIQAFTNRFTEDLALQWPEQDHVPYKLIRHYLWQHPLVCRYNADGRKSKSKGNHVWAVDGRKLPNGDIEFRPFARRIILPADGALHAVPGQIFKWDGHIFDPHTPAIQAAFSSPTGSLPDWLEWRRTRSSTASKKSADESSTSELSGQVPAGLECSLTIPVHASFVVDGQRMGLDAVVNLQIGSPDGTTSDLDMADSDDEGVDLDVEPEFDMTRPPSPMLTDDYKPMLSSLVTGSLPTTPAGPSSASAAAAAPMSAFGVPAAVVDGIAQVMDVAKARLEPDGEAAAAAQASNNAPAAAAVDMLTNPVQLFMKEQSITATTNQVGPIQAALMHQAELQREYDSVANMAVPPLQPAVHAKDEHLQHLSRACDQARAHVADVISTEQSRAIEQVARDPIAAAAALSSVDTTAAVVLGPTIESLTSASDISPPISLASATPAIPTSAGGPSASSTNISGLFVLPPHLQRG